ncbi:DNA/RNA helicase domain-containing protein [Nocardia tengchongensis]|uniref:DNA/RNA helicase domain-containing protein n=1 Tax=Nocardia tengchongensis TaxID=2055889 RepID=UPI00360DD699
MAWVSVFLLDKNQVVRPGESGSRAEIERAGLDAGCAVEVLHHDSHRHHRDRRLHRRGSTASALKGKGDESFQVTSRPTPYALEDWVRGQRSGTARLSAGYCWPWSSKPVNVDGRLRLVDDIDINGWRRPWNAWPDIKVPDAPDSYFWATDPRGIDQVGCIYTAQGFEYDWAGVIFGPDFVRRGAHWVARREYSHDGKVQQADDRDFAALTRNTYKVLLTRSMRGVAVYSTDPET